MVKLFGTFLFMMNFSFCAMAQAKYEAKVTFTKTEYSHLFKHLKITCKNLETAEEKKMTVLYVPSSYEEKMEGTRLKITAPLKNKYYWVDLETCTLDEEGYEFDN